MIVDSSALLAIMLREPEREQFLGLIQQARRPRMSAATYVEMGAVVDNRRNPVLSRRLDELLNALAIELEPVTVEHARVARAAYRDFGRGSGHPAHLNYGDCFAYALATVACEPLLFKGDDFGHTDVMCATSVDQSP